MPVSQEHRVYNCIPPPPPPPPPFSRRCCSRHILVLLCCSPNEAYRRESIANAWNWPGL